MGQENKSGKKDYSMKGFYAGSVASAICFIFARNLEFIALLAVCYLAGLIGYFLYVGSKKSNIGESWSSEEILESFMIALITMWGAGIMAFLFMIIGI